MIAPKIGGATLDDGTFVATKQKIDGAPSVLYDAVAILPSGAGAALLARDASAKDFCADAFAHCKFIGFSAEAVALFDAARVPEMDGGFVQLASGKEAKALSKRVARCAPGIARRTSTSTLLPESGLPAMIAKGRDNLRALWHRRICVNPIRQ